VTESGAIMLYLTDKYDKDRKFSFEFGTKEYYDVLQWMFFMNAGLVRVLFKRAV
jgi:glutathione S-transferase